MASNTIKLTYGSFTCSFTRNSDEDPSFGLSNETDPAPETPPTGGGERSEFARNFAPSQARSDGAAPMKLDSPVRGPVSVSTTETTDFDSAASGPDLQFIRSQNIPDVPEKTNEELLAKYNQLRATVLRMMQEASSAEASAETAEPAPKPVQPAPTIRPMAGLPNAGLRVVQNNAPNKD